MSLSETELDELADAVALRVLERLGAAMGEGARAARADMGEKERLRNEQAEARGDSGAGLTGISVGNGAGGWLDELAITSGVHP